jgi:TPR repeat protein
MGIGCRRDTLEANVWYVKAADHGDERAIARLKVINEAAGGGGGGKGKDKEKEKEKEKEKAGGKKKLEKEKKEGKEGGEKGDCVVM